MTVDLEDWRCALDPTSSVDYRSRPHIDEDYLVNSTRELLAEFDRKETKATFFVLGEVAEAVPELISEISRRGHEIASHSSLHLPPRMIPRTEFRARLSRDVSIIEEIIGTRPVGFRAPYFGVRRDETWIFEVLAQLGFWYDSSIVSTWTPYWGIPSAPKNPYFPDGSDLSKSRASGSVLEIPVSVWPTWTRLPGLPIAGGFYMRIWPSVVLIRLLKANVRRGYPLVLYIHPGNLDSQKEMVANITVRDRLSQYFGLKRGAAIFKSVMSEFKFDTMLNTFSANLACFNR